MDFLWIEQADSRATTKDSFNFVFKAVGEQDDSLVYEYAINNTPTSVLLVTGSLLWRQDISMTPVGWNQYLITVPYGPRDRRTGSASFSFDTTGATARIKCAKEHVKTYAASGVVNSNCHKGAINVTSDGNVEGAEIVIPALKLTATFRHPVGVVNDAYVKGLAAITGSMNSIRFRSYDPGELLFVGATGSYGTEAESELSYQFVASQNATLTIGDIADIVKKGHDYLWVEFVHKAQDGRPAVQPLRVHVERLYEPVDFGSYFGWR